MHPFQAVKTQIPLLAKANSAPATSRGNPKNSPSIFKPAENETANIGEPASAPMASITEKAVYIRATWFLSTRDVTNNCTQLLKPQPSENTTIPKKVHQLSKERSGELSLKRRYEPMVISMTDRDAPSIKQPPTRAAQLHLASKRFAFEFEFDFLCMRNLCKTGIPTGNKIMLIAGRTERR